ncbi:putative HTH-type transcriptional regulator YvdE [Weizmannia acidilactici]|uniref:LacI family DNA-binding transcriptional regulator n=1 Tax=Weizmannia acidilactici TaxID=2607726 RepID=UPI00124F1EFB|nr:LacI family DNA-binding transcriptional regulator [Weizmannia acidilactici]GER68414.1 putative HTH-type transcriptional regulator YvdE [Weizmannia acidilactici]
MVTISDVAKRAHVSKMTVSRVINHPEQVTDDLKKLVYEAMEQLNYVPNYAARALVSNRTQVIKFLILEEMDTTEPYYMNLLAGIAKELERNHYSLQLVTRKSKDIGQCDGVIATGVRSYDYDTILKEFSKPLILFGQNDRGFDFIDVNNEKGTRLLTEHVINLGFEKIYFFGIDLQESFMFARQKGYLDTVESYGLPRHLYRIKNSSSAAQKKAKEILSNWNEKCAFICASDRIALGVIRAAQSLQLLIPRQVAVTGFDGVFLDRISSPRITTVRQPVVEMGEACARMLLKKIRENGKAQGHQFFEPELLIRPSTVHE